MTTRVTRRAALKTLGATAGAVAFVPWLSDEAFAAFAEIQKTQAPPALKVLTRDQYATLQALVEAIIPTDERSPGAREARVADYVDLLLSEADDATRQKWTDGLAVLDTEATTRFGVPFVKLDAARTEALLVEASRNETVGRAARAQRNAAVTREERPAADNRNQQPADVPRAEAPPEKTPLQQFFGNAKQATIHGYYTSEIGIHKELQYKGNKVLLQFVGCQTEDGKDCPYCGQKAEA